MKRDDAELPDVALPEWAIVRDKRRAHIARVTHLLDVWAAALHLSAEEAMAWHDAGRWHDALRDADEQSLRDITGDRETDLGLLHGPAAAVKLAAGGEPRTSVLEAVRWHTVGNPRWDRTGRALYMADFLEPGRKFIVAERAFLASHLHYDFDAIFRQVVRMRIEWLLREGYAIFRETAELWNQVHHQG